eukprot:snap_masked-scaffold_16-processed-gene-2.21-mRNA-1 protein AED:1.00 eAED:1.00 QI:0/0/0/0/1/1/2/0/69
MEGGSYLFYILRSSQQQPLTIFSAWTNPKINKVRNVFTYECRFDANKLANKQIVHILEEVSTMSDLSML